MHRKPLVLSIVGDQLYYWRKAERTGGYDWASVAPEQMALIQQAVQQLPSAKLYELHAKLNGEAPRG